MTQTEIAKELGISKNGLSNILSGKRGCDLSLKNKILKYYPDLDFKLLNPRFIVKGKKENNSQQNNDFLGIEHSPDFNKTKNITFIYPKEYLYESWKEEALRHRKTLEELGFLENPLDKVDNNNIVKKYFEDINREE